MSVTVRYRISAAWVVAPSNEVTALETFTRAVDFTTCQDGRLSLVNACGAEVGAVAADTWLYVFNGEPEKSE